MSYTRSGSRSRANSRTYIAFPKPNGYQSLHTTVLTADAGIVEMQVRTTEMHQRAQFGIASHMSYKMLGKSAPKGAFQGLSAALDPRSRAESPEFP